MLPIHNGFVRMFQSKAWGWWYLCIGLCFLLLAGVHYLRGERLTVVALRVAVAAGFAILAWMQLRFRS
jgi:hypothetical protein